ncbi:hypothetical protein K443DRAFT_321905 [Laccaria amethystina LaAM-08-1]|uniref:Unplaced genomic scaffold K443scaffold_211, whole genome shotgun sequence n=1 Tax=Laccaria amethystina LaAM-08-1 TaxID=1095629 RepID=A0A0C9WU67_9AGAR|nr:hypothetical protein K443DRAFT_321905 [Laccaria amethystina LaAM-08-1]
MRNTEKHLISTIAYQLATSIPAARRFIEESVDHDPFIFSRTLQVQLERLIIQPLVHASLDPQSGAHWPTLLVIDSLDECDGKENQVSILSAFQDALLKLNTSLPTLYLLIASRPEPAIRQSFDHDLPSITHHIVLDNSYDPDRDIAVFLRSSFADILRRRRTQFPSMMTLPQSWPSDNVISFLVEKSSGQFTFAATVIRFIDMDRRVPTAQLTLIMNICQSTDSTRFATNPFVLLDQLYSFVLQSAEETEKVLSVLGVIFYLNGDQDPTPDFLASLLDLGLEEFTLLFWDVHSIVHVPKSSSRVIRFYHASFRDYLVDPYRSKELHVQEFKAHSLLCESCLRTLSKWPPTITVTDVHPGVHKPAVRYSSDQWAHHYTHGDRILQLVAWWDRFASARHRLHLRCIRQCSYLCSRYTSVFDQYLVKRYEKHQHSALVVAFLGLTVLLKAAPRSPHWVPEKDETHILDAAWLRGIISGDPTRSKSLFLGKTTSDAHFANACVQTIWRAICRKKSPRSKDTRMLKSLHDILEILILRTHTRDECDVGRTDAHRIKTCTKARMSELKKFLQFIDSEGDFVSFEIQLFRWKESKERAANKSSTIARATLAGRARSGVRSFFSFLFWILDMCV